MSFLPKRLPAALPFYERELGRLSRPTSKGWAQGRCPFHPSQSGKSFSVHRDGHFHCFGCGAHGRDLIAFIRLRDHCSFVEACKRLGAWADVSPAEQIRIDGARRAHEEEMRQAEDARRKARRQRLDVREEIFSLLRTVQESGAALDELHRCGMDDSAEAERQWSVLASAFEDLRLTESEYLRLCGLDCEDL